jgi:hypothetical protein
MNNREDYCLDVVRVEKAELLKKLRENRETHIAEFNKATDAFEEAVIIDLKDYLKRAKKGDIVNSIVFNRPTSHEEEYTTVIEMLEFGIDDYVDLSQWEFKTYVQDQWNWKEDFNTTNSFYMDKIGK